jgi:NAD(P)H dehydrogenase (quinone)
MQPPAPRVRSETLPEDVLQKMHAPPPGPDAPPVIDPTSDWPADADGFIFGTPTRFGSMTAQMKVRRRHR